MNEIATRNDNFRKLWKDVVFTNAVVYGIQDHFGLAKAVQSFDNFSNANDPFGEHDFGSFEYEGTMVFWKIDYYDQELTYGCYPLTENCRRVLTVMLGEDL